MINPGELKQLMLESAIKLFIFDNNELSKDDLIEYFNLMQIAENNKSEKLEKLFLLIFEHIRNHEENVNVDKIKNLFALVFDVEDEEEVNRVVNTYTDFLIAFGIKINKPDISVEEKLALLEAIDRNVFELNGEVRNLYLYSYLNLLLVQPNLDSNKLLEVTNELKNALED
jgi:hypothetical protein